MDPGKEQITIRLDRDVRGYSRKQVERAGGGNYQTLINNTLRSLVEGEQRPSLEKSLRIIREELRSSTLRDLAQLLWDAATVPQRRAEEEARTLAELLTDYVARLAIRNPQGRVPAQGVAANIPKVFREADDEQLPSAGVCRRVRLALYDIAVARFGEHDEFELLAYPGDRMDEHYSESFEIYWGGG
jgi:hypothetical protein